VLSTGALGQVQYLYFTRTNLGPIRSDVNVVWDLAPHDVSIFNHVLGSRPDVVQAWGSRHGHQDLEDVAYIRLLYRNPRVTATIHVSWLDPCKVRRVTVVGSQKMAVYNDLATEERVRIFDKGLADVDGAMQDVPMSYRYGDIRSPFLAFEEPLTIQDRMFVRSVLTRDRPPTDGVNGLNVVRALEAAEISIREGRAVELEEVDEGATLAGELLEVS
jgi:predicted dehydrogenase